jgi:ATP-dependent Lon protease
LADEKNGNHQETSADTVAENQPVSVAGGERVEVPSVLPVLPVRDVVIYPGVTVPLAVGRRRSLAALEEAGSDGFLIVATQKDPAIEDPHAEDLHPISCIVRVMRVIDAKRDGKQAVVVGIARNRLGTPIAVEPALRMQIDPIAEIDREGDERDAVGSA